MIPWFRLLNVKHACLKHIRMILTRQARDKRQQENSKRLMAIFNDNTMQQQRARSARRKILAMPAMSRSSVVTGAAIYLGRLLSTTERTSWVRIYIYIHIYPSPCISNCRVVAPFSCSARSFESRSKKRLSVCWPAENYWLAAVAINRSDQIQIRKCQL